MKDDTQVRSKARAVLGYEYKRQRNLVEKMTLFYKLPCDVGVFHEVIDNAFMFYRNDKVKKEMNDHSFYRREYEFKKRFDAEAAKKYANRYAKYIPSTPRNYFNTDALYHLDMFYKRLNSEFLTVQSKISELGVDNKEAYLFEINNQSFDLLDPDGFVGFVREKYFGNPNARNLYFVPDDLGFDKHNELARYKSLSQAQAEKETSDRTIWKHVPSQMEAYMDIEYALSVKNAPRLNEDEKQDLFLTVMNKHRNMIDSLNINEAERAKLNQSYLERYLEFSYFIAQMRGDESLEEGKLSAGASVFAEQTLFDENGYPLTYDRNTGAFKNAMGEFSLHAYNEKGVVVYDHENGGLGNEKESDNNKNQQNSALRERKSLSQKSQKNTPDASGFYSDLETMVKE